MRLIRAHFDGKVIVPDEPLDLKKDQELTVHIDVKDEEQSWMTPQELLQIVTELDFKEEDLDEMEQAIERGCEQVDDDGW